MFLSFFQNVFETEKIWFQNHRYKCKRQAKEKAMAEQNQHNQVWIMDFVYAMMMRNVRRRM